jgi:molybdopterin/thiamine biosynthesis adenylyltransferase
MRYSITFAEVDYRSLADRLHKPGSTEQAAYLLCSLSATVSESRLLVREVTPVSPEEIISASGRHMEIAPQSFMRAMKRADAARLSFVFVHSHPDGPAGHSPQDDITESSLFRTAYTRISGQAIHGSIVVSGIDYPRARVWHPDSIISPVEVIRVIGDRFRFFRHDPQRNASIEIFDRQVRAFGIQIQQVLKNLHVGIVGNGGTGSAVAEQLIRLGVGKLSLFEGQTLDASNVTRVYGSRLTDVDVPKVQIIQRLAKDIGFGTEVIPFPEHITSQKSAETLRNCDVIFGCTDDEWGRSILSKLAIDYYIPVIDMGVKIDSNEGSIVSVQGRVTTLVPGSACLFCRGRITTEGVRAQVIESCNPSQAEELRRQRYAPELQGNAPAVIAFTTAVASTAVGELLHRLTGFMGAERTSSEVIHFFDQSSMRTNHPSPNPNCYCGDRQHWGVGDQQPFLGMLWQG